MVHEIALDMRYLLIRHEQKPHSMKVKMIRGFLTAYGCIDEMNALQCGTAQALFSRLTTWLGGYEAKSALSFCFSRDEPIYLVLELKRLERHALTKRTTLWYKTPCSSVQ